jgi:hypothetical protein
VAVEGSCPSGGSSATDFLWDLEEALWNQQDLPTSEYQTEAQLFSHPCDARCLASRHIYPSATWDL